MELFAFASLSLVAGVVSFTAPCTLPLLPGYVSFVSGMSGPLPPAGLAVKSRVMVGATLFVLGFSVVFVALGVTASRLGVLLAQSARPLNLAAGSLIVLMGLVTAGALRIPILQRQMGFDMSRIGSGPRAAFPLGAAFGFGWTPCVGPVLASVLATAASSTTVVEGAVLLGAYSLGLGLPFLFLAAAVARGRGRLVWLRRHGRKIEISGGLLLAVMGIAVMSGQWTVLMSWMLAFYAQFGWPPI